jgi:hypothetical protein
MMSSELALESQGGDPALPEETLSLYHSQVDELDRITAATGLESPAQFAKKDAGALFADNCSLPPAPRRMPVSVGGATNGA